MLQHCCRAGSVSQVAALGQAGCNKRMRASKASPQSPACCRWGPHSRRHLPAFQPAAPGCLACRASGPQTQCWQYWSALSVVVVVVVVMEREAHVPGLLPWTRAHACAACRQTWAWQANEGTAAR
eukprot:357723-Chlamydomonas_euryale.AAC.29